MLDLLVKGALIYDGTGSPPFRADVGVKDTRIAAIGKRIPDAYTAINGSGLALAPGFVDSHSHADLVLHSAPVSYYKLEQGVTTEIAGSCGISPAPLSRERFADGLRVCSQFAAPPHEWESRLTFAGYMDEMDKNLGCNAALQIGHSEARAAVCGYANRELDASEMDALLGLTREAMQAGAIGVSFGLIYPPGSYANEAELTEVCRVAARYGGVFTIHMRSEGNFLVESVESVIRMARDSGCRAVISHHKAGGKANFGKTARTLELIDEANASGVEVYHDQYPYTASATGLNTIIPDEYHAMGVDQLVDMLGKPDGRARMRAILAKDRGVSPDAVPDSLASTMVGWSESRPDCSGKMLSEAAAEMGTDACELAFDLLRGDRMETSAIFFSMCEDDVERVMAHPRMMVGTDGLYMNGQRCHPRAYGSFPRFLGRYCRDRGIVTLAEGIRKITSMPAAVYNLQSKGLIREGMDADLTLFDPETIVDRADYNDFKAKNDGLSAVIVAGRVVVDGNEWNGKRFGRLIRRG
ncbi:MAG: D-aminoacylase [Oscillospiraceae bacterium]|jgi:N-acyl-D-aspartate/D-glutamate deacylase|nr:D-aminoacylase [Oscillospiraceae bacterium]